MTTKARLAAATLVVYWLAIIAGLALYSVSRAGEHVNLFALWLGVIGGTLLGQTFAMRDVRLWFALVIMAGIAIWAGPFTPPESSGLLFWMAFLPATFCGFASLSDRGSLVAFWFPAVIWMLSILDHGAGALKIDGASAALLGGLAFMFIAFLYARETRRVGMWRTIAPTPIAPATPAVILKEVPRIRLGGAGWTMIASSIAFAVTAWMAPKLWHVEPLVPQLHEHSIGKNGSRSEEAARTAGLPCCNARLTLETKRARVKEYFDLGRGHDGDTKEVDTTGECVVCDGDGNAIDLAALGTAHPCYNHVDPYRCIERYGYYGYGNGYGRPQLNPNYGNGYGTGYGDGNGNANGYGTGTGTNPWPRIDQAEGTLSGEDPWANGRYTPPSYSPTYPNYTPPPSYTPPADTPPTYTPPTPQVVEPPTPAVVEPPKPQVIDPPKPHEEPAIAAVEPPKPPTPELPPVAQRATPNKTAATQTSQVRNAPADGGPPLVQWLVVALAGALALQFLVLGMRPLRRALTLRHLRRPFWDETVDQRISNWWHLVLVGLRDAGWRTTSGEAPRELAKRLDIDGVERAASILERARHGISIDATDLAEMEDASETAYRTSRDRASSIARFLGWFRRPLV